MASVSAELSQYALPADKKDNPAWPEFFTDDELQECIGVGCFITAVPATLDE